MVFCYNSLNGLRQSPSPFLKLWKHVGAPVFVFLKLCHMVAQQQSSPEAFSHGTYEANPFYGRGEAHCRITGSSFTTLDNWQAYDCSWVTMGQLREKCKNKQFYQVQLDRGGM